MKAPQIFTRSRIGLDPPRQGYSPLGKVYAVTFHHAASARAREFEKAAALIRSFQDYHFSNGWSDIGYHLLMDDLGRLYLGRPASALGAHVGNHNTGNYGICILGNYEIHGLTRAQRRTIKWLFQTRDKPYGIPNFDGKIIRGHKEWSGHYSNACPGRNLMRHLGWRRSRS